MKRKEIDQTAGDFVVKIKSQLSFFISFMGMGDINKRRIILWQTSKIYCRTGGNTPLLELSNLEREESLDAEVIVKLEFNNPNQSVKDRTALALIQSKEKSGELRPGGTIVDVTSGNTGIALAAFAASKGYRFKVYIQDQVSLERFQVIKAFGGTPIKLSEDPVVAKLVEANNGDFVGIAKAIKNHVETKDNVVFVDQTSNLAKREFHEATTGPEIWKDTDGQVDIFVAAVGTGGTLSGVGKFLKSQNPDIQVVGVESGPNSIPTSDIPLPENEITGVHPFDENIPRNHIPKNVDHDIYDEIIAVEALDAYETARKVVRTEGGAPWRILWICHLCINSACEETRK